MLKKILLLLLVFCSVTIYGQNVDVRGQIVDEQNEPLIGASISVKGTTRATITDIDGNYTISVASGETLVFSLIGMTSKEIVYSGQSPLNVQLNTDDKLLEEVVVIGYQTIKKADLTGAVAVFNPDQMKNTIVTGTVGDALGVLPGLNVRTAGNPGSEGKVVIRGMGTFGNSDPLYVVDGVVSGANRDFNYNDIESIQVLKDASAAAIYGSRAGNGVIIITTKQGKKGDMKIEVSSRMTVQWLPKYDLTGRDRWIELNDLAFKNGGKSPANHFDANTDWQKEVFKNGIVNDHNLSLSGGGDKSRYFISGNFQSNSGTTIGADSKRYTLRSNTSSRRDFGDHFTFRVGENIALSHFGVNELDTNPIIDVYRMLPTIPIYDDNNKGGFGFGNGSRDVTFGSNPFAKEYIDNTRNSNLRIRGNAFTELEALKMLKYRFNFGFDYSNDKRRFLRKEDIYWSYNQPYHPSTLNKNQAQSRSFVFDNTLEFNKTFNKHDISAVFGTSYQNTNYEQLWGTKNDVMTSGSNYFNQLDAALSNPKTGSHRNIEKLFSVFGRINYNFDERYLLSFTMRRDESSKFSKDDRVGYFPSFSAGWRISNEKFFNVSWVDDLKIRANYGVLGTSNNGYYDYIALMNLYPQAIFGNDNLQSGMIQTALVNEKLKWEKMAQINAGFDALLLNNRLQVSADYFFKESKDVLSRMPIVLSTGHSGNAPWVNATTLQNTGVELSLTWKDQIGKDMDYSIGVNASYLKNKIKDFGYKLDDGFNQWNTKSLKGESIGQWYLIKTDGLFRSDAEVQAHRNSKGQLIQPDAKPGDVKYIDFNDDGQITDADRQYCGENMPKYELGINLGFRYKDFDIQVQMAGAFGHKIFNGPRSAFDRFDDNSNYRADYDPWTPENPNAKDPRPIYGDSRNVRGDQDRWLENGNYLKVKQMALGYNIPKSLLGNTLKSARVYVNAQNLITFTSYNGLDPEFLNSSIWERSYDGGAFPNPRGVTFGAQISF